MTLLEELPVNLAIELYFEKHHAIRAGDMMKLIALKKAHPEIFDKNKDQEIHDLIKYAKKFEGSERYKELLKLEMKEKLSILDSDFVEE